MVKAHYYLSWPLWLLRTPHCLLLTFNFRRPCSISTLFAVPPNKWIWILPYTISLLVTSLPLYFSDFSPIHQSCVEFCTWELPVGDKNGISLFALIWNHTRSQMMFPFPSSSMLLVRVKFGISSTPRTKGSWVCPLPSGQLIILTLKTTLCCCLYSAAPCLFQTFDPVSQALTKF